MKNKMKIVPILLSLFLVGCTVNNNPQGGGNTPGDQETTNKLLSIEISGNYKKVYEIGDKFDKTGLVVTASYDDNTIKDVSSLASFSSFDSSSTGEKEIVIFYMENGITVQNKIKVMVSDTKEATLSKLSIVNEPNKKEYKLNEEIDLTGLLIKAIYSDGTDKDVTSFIEVEGFDTSITGEKEIEFTYSEGEIEVAISYTINVYEEPISLLNIEIKQLPNVTTYAVGDTFDKTGLKVVANYSNKTSLDVTSKVTLSTANMNIIGEQIVTVTYIEENVKKETSFKITVKEKEKEVVDKWYLISDINDLQVGDVIIIGNASKNKVASSFASSTTSSYLKEASYEYTSDDKSFNDVLLDESYTLGKNGDFWTLKNNEGKLLGASAAKKLTLDSGTTTWNINITDGNATIYSSNMNYGRILFNSTVGRFTTYSSSTSVTSAMLLPQIYRGVEANPIYPTSIALNGEKEMYVGNSQQLEVSFDPITTNKRRVTFESSDTDILTVSSSGLVKGVGAGKGRITAYAINENKETISSYIDITVSPVAVTGVKLSASTKELAVDKTFTLTSTISPSNATNKNVKYSSNNTGVATVSDNGVVKGLKEGNATITVTTVDGGFTDKCLVTVKNVTLDEWTIMIYLCGTNLESEYDSYYREYSSLATSDIKEILSVSNQPDDVNIIIQTGGAAHWSMSEISPDNIGRFHVANKRLVEDAQLPQANMGSKETFKSFMEWGLTQYPADKTGVIFWNHGGGMSGVCFDENYYKDGLLSSEIHSALTDVFTSLGRTDKLEFVGYDACLMSVQDIAEKNSEFFNYMVSSQETESGYGWDYDNWVDDLYNKKSTTAILKEISDSFVSSYNESYGSDSNNQTMSYLNLSNMEEYKESFETLAEKLYDVTAKYTKSKFQKLMKKVTTYGNEIMTKKDYEYYSQYYDLSDYHYDSDLGLYVSSYGYTNFGLFDVIDFLEHIEEIDEYSSFVNDIEDVKDKLANVVMYSTTGPIAGNSNGLSLFFSLGYGCDFQTNYSTSETNFTSWRKFVSAYGVKN